MLSHLLITGAPTIAPPFSNLDAMTISIFLSLSMILSISSITYGFWVLSESMVTHISSSLASSQTFLNPALNTSVTPLLASKPMISMGIVFEYDLITKYVWSLEPSFTMIIL